jgi:hypothetical protein
MVALPDRLAARYMVLARCIFSVGPNLVAPHTDAVGDGLIELRLKVREGTAKLTAWNR